MKIHYRDIVDEAHVAGLDDIIFLKAPEPGWLEEETTMR